MAEKEAFRELGSAATTAHFARLGKGEETPEVSTLSLDLVRDMGRVNGYLVAAAAYPVLEREGALLPSRLRAEDG